jgi:hypothetical protein
MTFTHLIAPRNDTDQYDAISAAIRIGPKDVMSFYWQGPARIMTFRHNEKKPYSLFRDCLAQNALAVSIVHEDDRHHASMHESLDEKVYEHCHLRSVTGDITPQDLGVFLNGMAECRDRLISQSYNNQHRTIGLFFNPEHVDTIVAANQQYRQDCQAEPCPSHLAIAELVSLFPASAMPNVTALGHAECRYQHWLDGVDYRECMRTFGATTHALRSADFLRLPSTTQWLMTLALALIARVVLRACVVPRPNPNLAPPVNSSRQ